MKIYCARQEPNEEYSELEFYLDKIVNKDLWLALREDDLYNIWIKASNKSGKWLYIVIYNTAYYPKDVFMQSKAFTEPYYDFKDLWLCEVLHPVTILTSEELADWLSTDDDHRPEQNPLRGCSV